MSERPSRPWKMFLPLGLVLLLAAGWSAYWFIAMNEIQKGLAREEAKLADVGITLACAKREFGGFPFRFMFECESPALAINQPGTKVSAASGNLKVYVQAWNFRHAIALLEGPTNVAGQTSRQSQALTHGTIRASLRMPANLQGEAIVDIPDLAAEGLGKAAKIILAARMTDAATTEFSVNASALSIRKPDGGDVTVDAAAALATAPLALVAAPDPLRRAASASEVVTLKSLSLSNGPLKVTSDGTIGLDANGFPAGVNNATASNLDMLFAELVKAGALSEKDAGNARTMSLLLNGGKVENAAMKFVAKDGGLYWGLVKLADLQPLM